MLIFWSQPRLSGAKVCPKRRIIVNDFKIRVNLVDRIKSFPTSVYSRKSASIHPRTSLSKFGSESSDSIIFSFASSATPRSRSPRRRSCRASAAGTCRSRGRASRRRWPRTCSGRWFRRRFGRMCNLSAVLIGEIDPGAGGQQNPI